MAGLKNLMESRKRYAAGGSVDGGHSTQVGPMGRSSAPARAGGGHDPARDAGRDAPHDAYFLAHGGGVPGHSAAGAQGAGYFAHGGEAGDGPEVSPELK